MFASAGSPSVSTLGMLSISYYITDDNNNVTLVTDTFYGPDYVDWYPPYEIVMDNNNTVWISVTLKGGGENAEVVTEEFYLQVGVLGGLSDIYASLGGDGEDSWMELRGHSLHNYYIIDYMYASA